MLLAQILAERKRTISARLTTDSSCAHHEVSACGATVAVKKLVDWRQLDSIGTLPTEEVFPVVVVNQVQLFAWHDVKLSKRSHGVSRAKQKNSPLLKLRNNDRHTHERRTKSSR